MLHANWQKHWIKLYNSISSVIHIFIKKMRMHTAKYTLFSDKTAIIFMYYNKYLYMPNISRHSYYIPKWRYLIYTASAGLRPYGV